MAKIPHLAFAISLLFLLVMAGCEQSSGPVGSEIGSDLSGEVLEESFFVEEDTSFAPDPVSTGASPYLFAGSSSGVRSLGLLKFYRPLQPFSWRIDSAVISLHYKGGIGSGEIEVQGQVHDFSWSESEPPLWEEVPSGDEYISEFPDVSGDSGSISARINIDWIDEWLRYEYPNPDDTTWTDATRNDSALTFKIWNDSPESIDRIVRFYSRNTSADSLRPKLEIFITAKDSAEGIEYPDTLSSVPAMDIFVVKTDSVDIGVDLLIGSGSILQSNMRFNFDELYELKDRYHLVVNYAQLTLHKIPGRFPELPETNSIWPFKLNDMMGISDPLNAQEAGLTYVPTAIDSTSETVEITVTGAATQWINDREENYGLALHSGAEGLNLDRLAFYSSEAANFEVRPELFVKYTKIKK